MERTNIYISRKPAPDGSKHEFVMYDYGEYQFRKEWYMNLEDEYVMGLTLFKNGKEMLHVGTANEESTDDEWTKFAEDMHEHTEQFLNDNQDEESNI